MAPAEGSFLDSLLARAANDLECPLNLRIRANGFETVVSMVEARLGVGLVPEQCAERYLAAGRLVVVPLDEEWATRHWKICVRDVASLPSSVRLLVKHLRPEASPPQTRIREIVSQPDRVAV